MKFLTSTAMALAIATPMAFAQTASTDSGTMADDTEMAMNEAQLIRTRDITGGTVYTTNEANDEGWDSEYMYEEVGADWAEIGEIEDIVLTHDGRVAGIVVEVGGFLDIGDKHVMLETDDLNLVALDDASYHYVTRMNEEDLESMQGVDEGFWN